MSEAATRPHANSGALLASLDPLLRAWLPRQRWFAGKGRPISVLEPVSVTELLPPSSPTGLLHLLVRARRPMVPAQDTAADGRTAERAADCYQLLIGVRRALAPHLAPALIGHVTTGPLAGYTVYEALHDPHLMTLLLERLRMPGRHGVLRFERDPHTDIPSGLTPRVLTAEQSNSSVVYGDTFILKLFRRVMPGVNPDLELPLHLARRGCARVPAPAAWFHADLATETTATADTYGLGVVQPYLAGAEDGWELALRMLGKGEDFTGEARTLGRATAEVHRDLAAALPTVSLGRAQVELIADGMAERLGAAAQAVPALRPFAPALLTAYEALADLGGEGGSPTAWTAQRVHGDLHLGQFLRSPDGTWSLIDFEGEPARPLTERRMPQPTARDVAGMLRSFDYAVSSAEPRTPEWAADCRAAYCAGYADVSGRDPRMDPVLLRAHETDKAVYEVLYEARHRPDWLPVPLAAVRRLARNGSTDDAH
ncbi:maltokinase [Streptomyces sp. NPDC059002]|uniref:maltokinase N-terminal cap-like domain-containing protein n=1 Tax=Streptomyces sp. NPDC059002 TaxID=3346690 RepID=UPI0036AA62C1